jgi:hypothetical protein
MRDGAGELLSHIAADNDEVTLEITDDLMAFDPEFIAIHQRERDAQGGAEYLVYDTDGHEITTVWMSAPLRFYYGKYPDKFLIRRRFPYIGPE